jgi:hypothetical protein
MRVVSTACDSAWITSAVSKWRPYSFIFNRWNRKVGWVWDDSHVDLVKKKSLVEKELWDGALSWCDSQFFWRQSSERSVRTFSRSHPKTSQECWLFGLAGRILCEYLMAKKMMSMLLTLLFTCLALFGLGQFGLSSPNACLINVRDSVALFRRFAKKFDAHWLLGPLRNRNRPDTRLKIKGRKSPHPTSCVKFCTLTPKIC